MKKNQMSPELMRRLIRVEQMVSSHFKKPITYQQTEYFKSLSKDDKKRFELFLKKEHLNKKRKFLLPIVIGLLILPILILNITITGEAIQNTLHIDNLILTGIFVVMLVIVFAYFVASYIDKTNQEKRFKYHLKPLEKALAKK